MNIIKSTLLPTSLCLAILSLASCETSSPSPEPDRFPVVIQHPLPKPTPKPKAPPPLNIPERPVSERVNEALIRHAGNHAVVMKWLNRLESEDIRSSAHLNEAMDGLSQVYSPGLGASMISYGALIGAQNSAFVDGVLQAARTQGLDTVVYGLYANPDYATTLPGADIAAAEIQNAWASHIAQLGRTGARLKQQSYSLQKQPEWKKKRADNRQERMNAIKQAARLRFTPPYPTRQTLAEIGSLKSGDPLAATKRQKFWQVFGLANAPRSQTFANQYGNLMNKKALTLGALEILGATGKDSTDWIENYMISPALNQCLKTASLNTQQCLAAGHFKYEDAFCMAEHELKEIANCLTSSTL